MSTENTSVLSTQMSKVDLINALFLELAGEKVLEQPYTTIYVCKYKLCNP